MRNSWPSAKHVSTSHRRTRTRYAGTGHRDRAEQEPARTATCECRVDELVDVVSVGREHADHPVGLERGRSTRSRPCVGGSWRPARPKPASALRRLARAPHCQRARVRVRYVPMNRFEGGRAATGQKPREAVGTDSAFEAVAARAASEDTDQRGTPIVPDAAARPGPTAFGWRRAQVSHGGTVGIYHSRG